MPSASQWDELLSLIYEGPLQHPPWRSALPALRRAMQVKVASLILRPPAENDRGAILNSVRPGAGEPDTSDELANAADWQVTAYREQFFNLDPFVGLSPDTVVTLDDMLPDDELVASDYYLQYLQPVGLFRILGADTREPGGMQARLRFSRERDEPAFGTAERRLLQRLLPHFQRALQIHAQLTQTATERDIYAGAVEQLAVASIIVDERGRILSTNTLARNLLQRGDALRARHGVLTLIGRDANAALQRALEEVFASQRSAKPALARALRVARDCAGPPLGLVVRPAPQGDADTGAAGPRACVFVSDPELNSGTSQQTLGELFALTPAEANIAVLLSRGLSLAETAEAQNISPHTARAQLKSIFAKTGVSRQAELVRLVLSSAASLGG